MKQSFLVVPALLGGVMWAAPAQAAIINVPNYSFEDDVLADGKLSRTYTGWVGSPTGVDGNEAFLVNPDHNSFPGADGQGTPVGADGAQMMGLQNLSNITSATSLATITAKDLAYTLTVAIGDPLDTPVPYFPGDMAMGFKLNDAVGPGTTLAFQPANSLANGQFKDFTFTYVTKASDIGKDLKIYLAQTTGFGSNIVALDNVRLSVEPVPEPTTWAMMTMGLGALFYMSKRRRKPFAATAA